MYKAEFFSPSLNFKRSFPLDESCLIAVDYLTMDCFDIEIQQKNIKVSKGDFCRISRVNGGVVQDFAVADCSYAETKSNVSLRPLQALLDVDVYNDGIDDCAAWLTRTINEYLVKNADTWQNRPIVVENQTSAAERPISTEETAVNLLDVMTTALTVYRVIVQAALDLQNQKVVFAIQQMSASATLEADLGNIVEKEIVLGDSYGSKNKYILRRVQTDQGTGMVKVLETRAYYLHPNGSVDSNNENRITPVFWALGELEDSETWEADALSQAVEALTPEQYDNEIRLDYKKDDPMIIPEEILMGTEAVIYMGGQAYKSLLTGREWDGNIHRLVFGCVRTDLTKKIILQRRNA